MVEVYSASSGCWLPALVTQVQPGEGDKDILTMHFYYEDEPKQKSLYRGDSQLAPLGLYTAGQLPPGFQVKPSQTRSGQLVYLDATTNVKYGSPELAWHVHFERLMQHPVAGCATVCAVPAGGLSAPSTPARSLPAAAAGGGSGSSAPSSGGRGGSGASPPQRRPWPQHAGSSPSLQRPLSLAELQAGANSDVARAGQGGTGANHGGRGWPGGGLEQPSPSGGPGTPPQLDLSKSGRIKLPSFGDAMGSQAAYLSYEHKAGAEKAAAQAPEAYLPANTAQYPAVRGATATHRPAPPPRNPALQAWAEDPFSQWRQ